MAIYRSELSAIVCGVNAGMTPIVAIQSWQGQYKSGFVEDLTKRHSDTEKLNAIDKLAQDSITRARIKRNAKRGGFYAMVAKYGADEQERANAVNELVKLCDIDCTAEGKKFLIWLWAVGSKQRTGLIGQALDLFSSVSERTFFRRKKEIFNWLNNLEGLAISEVKEVLAEVL
jgi:hypothetical protein